MAMDRKADALKRIVDISTLTVQIPEEGKLEVVMLEATKPQTKVSKFDALLVSLALDSKDVKQEMQKLVTLYKGVELLGPATEKSILSNEAIVNAKTVLQALYQFASDKPSTDPFCKSLDKYTRDLADKGNGGAAFILAQQIHQKLLKSKTGIFSRTWLDSKGDQKQVAMPVAKPPAFADTLFAVVVKRGGIDEVAMRAQRMKDANDAVRYYQKAHSAGNLLAACELFKLNGIFKGKLVPSDELVKMLSVGAAQGHSLSKTISARLQTAACAQVQVVKQAFL